MKRLCLILFVLLLAAPAMAEEPLQLARMSGPMLGSVAAAAEPTLYYSCTGSDTYDDHAPANVGYATCADIAITTGGSITQIGFKSATGPYNYDVKLALYNTSGTRLSTGCEITANILTGWNACTIEPYSVASSATVRVCRGISAGSINSDHHNTGNGYWAAAAYADFPAASYTLITDSGKCHAFSVLVE